ncbi:hypothetical protein pclt_cds_55 [Pandoravirus celtis]|uniref:Uncharacterized protein n=1 Tax=Pandoravirus celtis TaxID=2568002 RepID=A0A4D6EGZ7_9VIRU|nr:hypothetical protein pclt_cds_55 [Pandoravirus celtis]
MATMEMGTATERPTKKRHAPLVRPEVVTAVGLCAQSPETLSPAQIRHLVNVAIQLGMPAWGDPRIYLPEALGDEWTDAVALQDASTETNVRVKRRRAALPDSERTGAFCRASIEPSAPTSIWHDLPPELRMQVAERLAEMDMRTVMALYGSNRDARAVISRLHRDVPAVDSHGTLVRQRVPLIDYARLASVLGESDPIRLFLASALCTLRSFADLQVDETTGIEQALGFSAPFDGLDAVVATAQPDAPRGPTGRLVYSALITDGIAHADLEKMPAEYWEMLASSLGTAFDARASLSGPLADDLPGVVAQWRHWTVGTDDVLVDAEDRPRLPVAARYDQILGWNGPSVMPLVCLSIRRHDLLHLAHGSPPLDTDSVHRLRWLGTVNRDRLATFLGRPPKDIVLGAWMEVPEGADDAVRSLQEDLGEDRRVMFQVLRGIADEATLYQAPQTCAAAQRGSPFLLAPLENLLAQSNLWLLPLSRDSVGILGDLVMPALDEALTLATAQQAPRA